MEEIPSGNDAVSTQKSLLPFHDPGWNDPPKWAYSSPQSQCATPGKRVLNKRVAFPLNSAVPQSNIDPLQPLSTSVTNIPVPPQPSIPCAPPPTPSGLSTEGMSLNVAVTKEQALKDTMGNLECVIKQCEDLKGKTEEVRKRLDIMRNLWMEDKLTETIHKNVLEISEALRCNDCDRADKLHVSMVMEHAALCSSWVPGIRYLIQEAKKNYDRTETTDVDKPHPYLLPTTDTELT
ncbi:steroid receptor RNA activator 1 [Orussus abietinus]|uniref:steroid receptor RNA activator 1 n=1 Tax=Orussus abietinus TaxID=222816 RepID=UPI0006251CA6|nr:steroid receptor RNA activator 1 [Orussus abietinus]